MSDTKVSFIVSTYNRKESLIRTIKSILNQEYENFEVIIICNSTDSTPALFSEGGKFHKHNYIKYIHIEDRMGVIKARNLGYERADGEIMITIDDDAVFSSPQVTANAVKALEETSAKIVAMKVINNYSGEIEFPPNGSDLQDRIPLLRPQTDLEQSSDSYRMTTLFTGCANAIHQDVLDDIGRYPPSYDYGVEEFDLSLRAIDAGFDIVYCPNCVVIHYEEPDGRFEDDKIQKELFKNRIATSLRNHPIRYIVLSWCIWSARLLFRSGGNVKLYLISNFELYEEFSEILENRNKISRDTIERIRELGGRIF